MYAIKCFVKFIRGLMYQGQEVDQDVLLVPDSPSTRWQIPFLNRQQSRRPSSSQNDTNSRILHIANSTNYQMCSYPRFMGPLLKTAPSYESQGRQRSFYVE
jgi:hypothetical protein